MDVRQLQALVAVAETGTFSAAAGVLHTVQSNISAHVARLEKELGVTLVDRSGGRLTDEGEAVVARSRRVFYELDALRADVAALGQEVRGTARLGMIGTAGRWLVPVLLDELERRHPGIHLVVVEGQSTSLEPRLASGELDVSLLNLSRLSPDLTAEPLFDEDLVLVVRADDPWADRAEVSIADLGERELLLPVVGTAYRDEVEAAARADGVTLQLKAELDGLRLIASLTFEGTAASILPASAVPSFMRDDWRSLPVAGLPRRRIVLGLRRRGLPSAPARAVIDVLREVVVRAGEADDGIHPTVASMAH
jgi:LysR family hydrogen peroxide-inducible transcriptional activator